MSFGKLLRNVGNKATSPAMGKAIATSNGTNTPRRIVKHTGKGSSAGLNAQPTARLQMNGAGYSNPALHTKRGAVRPYPRFETGFRTDAVFNPPRTNNPVFNNTKPKTLI